MSASSKSHQRTGEQAWNKIGKVVSEEETQPIAVLRRVKGGVFDEAASGSTHSIRDTYCLCVASVSIGHYNHYLVHQWAVRLPQLASLQYPHVPLVIHHCRFDARLQCQLEFVPLRQHGNMSVGQRDSDL